MPVLFYGTIPGHPRPRLYSEKLKPFETSIFDQYKISGLAPYRRHPNIANFWHIRTNPRCIHSCLSWHNDDGIEQSVFLPGEMNWREALAAAREIYPELIPSAIIFRVNNHDGVYWYD